MNIKEHILQVGFNDKDTKVQKYTTKAILSKIEKVLQDLTTGYTMHLNDFGGYKHDDGTQISEKSATISLMFIEDNIVKQVINTLKLTLNQESILHSQRILEGDFE